MLSNYFCLSWWRDRKLTFLMASKAFFRSSASLPSKTRNCFAHSFIHSFVENYFCFFTVKIVSHSFNCRACTSKTDSTMKGTCYTQSECTSKSGTSGGNCAAGKLNEYLKMSFLAPRNQCFWVGLILRVFYFQALEFAACSRKKFT